MHLCVVFRHSERTGIDAVATVKAPWFQRRHYYSIFRNLDRISRTNKSARWFVTVHTDCGHCGRRLSPIDVIDEDHRITFVCRALAARSHTGAAADAALRIDEHGF